MLFRLEAEVNEKLVVVEVRGGAEGVEGDLGPFSSENMNTNNHSFSSSSVSFLNLIHSNHYAYR